MSVRLLVMLWVILRPIFTDFSDFLGIIYSFHVAVRMTTCFFFRICPPEELDNKRSSPRRGDGPLPLYLEPLVAVSRPPDRGAMGLRRVTKIREHTASVLSLAYLPELGYETRDYC